MAHPSHTLQSLRHGPKKDKKSIESNILDLNKEGHSNAMIGTILRDRFAVPDVRLVMGERISQILLETESPRITLKI